MNMMCGYCSSLTPQDALSGQVAVVTGGSGGIGQALVERLDELGCHCVVAGRNASRIEQVVRPLRHAVGFAGCDVRDAARIEELFDFVLERFGRLDTLIVCAGVGRGDGSPTGLPRTVVRLTEDEWDDVIDTNLKGAFLACRSAGRIMTQQRSGQIVNISSARGGRRGHACGAGYCASKMAVRAMFQSLAAELSPFGVRVTTFLPDAVDTRLIAGTTLAPRGAMSAAAVARLVVDLLATPMDATWDEPLAAPLGAAALGRARLEATAS